MQTKLTPGKLYEITHELVDKDGSSLEEKEVLLLIKYKKQYKGNQTKYTFLYNSDIVSIIDLPCIVCESLEELI